MKQDETGGMRETDIRTEDICELTDIDDMEADKNLSERERRMKFSESAGNPFCCACNGIIVKIFYADTKDTLEKKLVQLCRMIDT